MIINKRNSKRPGHLRKTTMKSVKKVLYGFEKWKEKQSWVLKLILKTPWNYIIILNFLDKWTFETTVETYLFYVTRLRDILKWFFIL